MAWLKKNLLLVISGAVALILLGAAGFFLYLQISKERDVTDKLSAQSTELDRLTKIDPQPTPANIDVIRGREKDLLAFVAEARKSFVPLSYPSNLDSGQFKLLLDTAIDELRRAADQAGVKISPGYAFTFSGQKSMVSFEANTIRPMAMALADIRELCSTLFGAKVLALDNIRRISVAAGDTPGPNPGQSEYWTRKISTNDLAYLVPYEFTFHSFTSELGAVLQTLARSPHCFIVKSVVVDTTPSPLLVATNADTATPTPAPLAGGMNAAMMARYGLGRYRGAPQPVVPDAPVGPTPVRRNGQEILLEEKPFRVVMWIDVVRLRDPNEGAAAKGVKPAARPARGEAAGGDAAAANPPSQ